MNNDRQRKLNYTVGFVAVAFLALMAIQYFPTGEHIQQIPYSQFKGLLADGKVREVIITAEQVQGVQYTGKTSGTVFGGILSWVLPMLTFFVIGNKLMRRVGMGGQGILSVGQSKARIVPDTSARRFSFQDVAGIDEAREELVEVVEFLKRPGKFEEIGGRVPKGVLLVGAGNRQDAPGQGSCRRSGGSLFQHIRKRVRRDVRRGGGGTGEGPVCPGQKERRRASFS